MLKQIGRVIGVYGAVYFSTSPGVKNTEVAFASLARTDTGLLFVHEVDSILLNIFDPLYVHYWFQYLLIQRTAITAEILFSEDIVNILNKLKVKTSKERLLPLITVGYPEEQKQFFSTFDPSWTPVSVSSQLVEEYILSYQTHRTKASNTEPRLQFSQVSQFQKVSTNLLAQVAIGMALTFCSQDDTFAYVSHTAKFTVRNEEPVDGFWSGTKPVTRNPYIFAR